MNYLYDEEEEEQYSNYDDEGGSEPPEEGGELNLLERIIGIIIAPKDTMSYLIQNPNAALPGILITLTTFVYFGARLGPFKEYLKKALLGLNTNLTPEVIDAVLGSYYAIIGVLAHPILTVLGWVVGTFVLSVVLKYFMKRFIDFKTLLTITGNSYIVIVVFYVISLIISVLNNSLMLDASLGAVIGIVSPSSTGTGLYGFLRAIDIFNVWQYFVIAQGVSVATDLEMKNSYIASFTVMILFVFLSNSAVRFLN